MNRAIPKVVGVRKMGALRKRRQNYQLVLLGLPHEEQPPKYDDGPMHTEWTLYEAIDLVAEGWSLSRACKEHDWLPPYKTLKKWFRENPEFDAQLTEATEAMCATIEDEIIDIADGNEVDRPGQALPPDPLTSKMRIEARQWMLGITNRDKYGKNVPAVQININLRDAMNEAEKRISQGVIIDG